MQLMVTPLPLIAPVTHAQMANAPGISAFPKTDSNLLEWAATIAGPPDSVSLPIVNRVRSNEQPYTGLSFKLQLNFPPTYPYTAPHVTFITPMYHPNIDMSGNICLDILKEEWSAVYNVQTILLSIQSMLAEPNPKSPLNAQYILHALISTHAPVYLFLAPTSTCCAYLMVERQCCGRITKWRSISVL